MPENPVIPTPSELFGEPKRTSNKIPPPDELFSNKPSDVSDEPYYKMLNGDSDEPNIEGALQMIKKSSRRNVSDSDLQTLKDVLINPQATEQQRKDAIGVIQGYAPEHKDSYVNPKTGKDFDFTSRDYYIAPDKNGVLMPKAIKYGEKPPKGFHVASDWGTQGDANDDSWYTDISKGLINGVIGTVKGVAATAGAIATEITGEENKRAENIKNSLESLKFIKDDELESQIYNSDGINKWADLIDKKRFDFSPKALWGTFNSAVESLSAFGAGAGATQSAFLGSFLAQISDDIDKNKDAGLKGRDAVSMALLETSIKAGLDASIGLEGMLFRGVMKDAEKEVIKQIAKTVEKDAVTGLITEQGFKQVAKELVPKYTSFAKELAKDTGKEMFQESTQEFTDVSAEQLWDKLSDKDKAKFGSDVTSPKAFARYLDSFINSAGMTPIAGKTARDKQRYEKQSIAAYEAVKKGTGDVAALKANIDLAKERGELTPEEVQQAKFKIDAYETYNKQVSGINLSDEEKKDAFEKSFNVAALTTEANEDEKTLDNLSEIEKPLTIASIKGKRKLAEGLQKELTDMLLAKSLETETKVDQKTTETVVKNNEKKRTTPSAADLLAKVGGVMAEKGDVDLEETVTDTPDKKESRMKLFNAPSVEFNQMAWEKPTEVKAAVQEHLKSTPKNEMDVTIREAQNGRFTFDIGDNKNVWFAQSVQGEKDNYFNRENLPPTRVETEDRGGDAEQQNEGLKIGYYKEPAVVKRVEFEDEDRNGEVIVKAVLPVYNKESGKFIGFAKEHKTGKSFYTEDGKVILGKILKSNLYDEELKEYAHIPNREVKGKPKPKKVEKVTPVKEVKVKEVDFDKLASKAVNEKELNAIVDQADAAEYPIDIEAVIKKRESLKAAEAKAKEKKAKDDEAAKKTALKEIKELIDKEINQPKDKPKNLKEEREAAVKEASKPELKLELPTKNLDADVKVKKVNKETGEVAQEESTVKLVEAKANIAARFKILEMLNNCLHGS